MDRDPLASAARRPARRRRRGAALVFVLAILAVATTLLWYLLAASHTALGASEAALAADRLRAAAADAARRALLRLADDDDPLADSLGEPWAREEVLADPTGILTRTKVEDDDRRFDANNLALDPQALPARPPEEIVADLLRLCGDPAPSLKVEALRDWIDAGDVGRYEKEYYARRPQPRTCPNAPVASWREWSQVEGFGRGYLEDPSLGESDDPPVPVAAVLGFMPGPHTRPLTVNVNTASERVLAGLFGVGQEGFVRSVVALRDAFPLRSLDAVAAIADPLRFDRVRPYLDVRSWRYTVTAVASDERGREARVMALAVRLPQGALRIVRWVE